MNSYTFAQISVGQQESFTVKITAEMLGVFADLTGDRNPLHTNREFALAKGHRDRVCYGMLTASFLSTLAGEYMPGERSLIHAVDVEFPLSVYPGDELTITGTVKEKDERFNTINLKVLMVNQTGKKVCRANMRVGVGE